MTASVVRSTLPAPGGSPSLPYFNDLALNSPRIFRCARAEEDHGHRLHVASFMLHRVISLQRPQSADVED
jgi:hypothetical protein